ncbi:MAG: hypothetical protein AB9846_10070 [Tenuifilaceae bacterium]
MDQISSSKGRKFIAISFILFVLSFSLVKTLIGFSESEDKFSGDINKFPVELNDILKQNISPENDLLIKEFTKFWTIDSVLKDDQKKVIVNDAILLLNKSITSRNHFFDYVQLIIFFYKDEYAKSNYNEWEKGFNAFLTDSKKSIGTIADFIKNSLAITSKSIINSNAGYFWKTNKSSYKFRFTDKLIITFDSINLVCSNQKDSIYIKSTNGVYDISSRSWVGSGGIITWARSGYPENEIFATLNKYRINLNQNNYSADSVLFTNHDYFDKPSLGKITDWLVKDYKPETITYPEFKSYDQWFQIKNLFENIDYEGGFTMRGSKLIGTGGQTKLATLIIKHNEKEVLKVEGNIMIFHRQIINSEKAKIRFKFEKDSIYHVGLDFNYNDKNKTVVISSTEKLLTQSPFSSSFHKLSISTNQLSWKITDDKILFGSSTGSALSRATFESDNFFNEERFDRMMGPDEKHPLLALSNYASKVRSKYFLAEDMAGYLRKSVEQVRIEMIRMAMLGYIFYDLNTDEIQIKPKLYDAIRARGRHKDYDVILFSSQTNGSTPNAVLDLKTMDLLINGIENISVSDSQNVHIFPAQRQVVMQKNRDFSFAGAIRAGLFTYYGKKFKFDYGDFKIVLEDVDSLNLDFKTEKFDMYGRKVLNTVASTFEKIKGDILIDKPDNKSGLKDNKGYPVFNSTMTSFIYYDAKSIFNGVYKRDSFYFEVLPFQFANLNAFNQSDMNFKGILYSSDILAPIEDSLRLRPDNSLGFVRKTPPEGLTLFQGKGKIFNTIDLSNRGLRSDGQVKYITSTTTSDDIYLFPDSMVTKATNFTIDKQIEGIQYPETKGDKHLVKWYPKREKLYAYKGLIPFNMYANEARLIGDLLLEPLGLIGSGTVKLENAKLLSSKYEFNADDFITESTSIDLYTPGSDSIAFDSKVLKAKIDFLSREGVFTKKNLNISANLLPLRYEAYLDKAIWFMDKNEMTFSTSNQQKATDIEKFHTSSMADRDSIPVGSLFYSVKFNEDSLYFFSPVSKYNLKTSALNADSVKYLLVADAIVYPKEKKVSVEPARRMLPLRDAIVSANRTKKFHKIYDAYLNIFGRKKYSGNGLYDYIDERDSIQIINLAEIGVTDKQITYANGIIAEQDKFNLSPQFSFIGKVALNAPDKFLHFNGGSRPIFNCKKLNPNLVRFESMINPDSVLIPITETPQNIGFARLINGSIITEDSIKLYGSLLGIRKSYSDIPFVLASGYMNFNNNNRRFTIGPEYKLFNPDSSGNTISLQKDFCMMFGEGKIVLPIELGQLKLKTNGSLIHKLEDNTITIDAILQMNFHFNQKSLEAMATELNSFPMIESVDLKRKIYKKTLYENLDPKDAAVALNQINLFGSMSQVPKGFESTITLADLKLKWNQKTRSFISSGKIGIGTIGNIQVNKKINGYVEITKRRSGDYMTLYLHLGEDKYYVFAYTKGSMQVSSSNNEFVEPIKLMKQSDRKVKVPLGQQKYSFLIGTTKELSMARQRYKQLVEGIDTGEVIEDKNKEVEETEEEKKIR